jgi:hypothetical protein
VKRFHSNENNNLAKVFRTFPQFSAALKYFRRTSDFKDLAKVIRTFPQIAEKLKYFHRIDFIEHCF